MKKNKHVEQNVPYNLSALDGRICAMSNDNLYYMLIRMDGAKLHKVNKPDGTLDFKYVSLTATRESFMAVEALAAPAFVAPEYLQLRSSVMQVAPELNAAWMPYTAMLRRPFLPHQNEFCALALNSRGMLNASEQGTGKTGPAIALLRAWNFRVNIIVAPKSIMTQWQEEHVLTLCNEALRGLTIMTLIDKTVNDRIDIIGGVKSMLGTGELNRVVLIVNYDVLYQLEDVLLELVDAFNAAIVFDESWLVKNPNARSSRSAIKIADTCVRALCLTGTPTGQGVADLWSQLRIIEGKEIEDKKLWNEQYVRYIWAGSPPTKRTDGCKDAVGMMRRLAPWFYRATTATSLQLPPSPPARRIMLDFAPETRELYKYVKEYGESGLGDGSSLMGERSTLIRLQQITGGFVFNPDGTYTEEEAGQPHDLRMRFISSPKMDWLLEYAQETLAGNPTMRAIIWCKFNTEIHHIAAKLNKILDGRVAMAIGDTTTAELDETKASFNSRDADGIQVVVGQYAKLCAGHNMQAGDVHVRYSHTWSHIQNSQAFARSYRLGRTAPVIQYDLVIRNTIDMQIVRCTDQLQDMQTRLAPDTTSGYSKQETVE